MKEYTLEDIIFVFWILIIILQVYFLIRLIRLNIKFEEEIKEEEEKKNEGN